MKISLLLVPGLGILLGLAACNTPAARAPEAARPAGSHLAPLALPAAPVQAVRYQLLTETATKPGCLDAHGNSRALEVSRQFLHLLGPDTLLPALQKLQCPLPAQRRAQLQQELKGMHCESEDDAQYSSYSNMEVSFNAHGVLSLLVMESADTGGAYPQNSNELCTYDLATGKLCPVEKWLRPGHDLALRQLFTKCLLADSTGKEFAAYRASDEEGAKAKPYVVDQLPSLGMNKSGLFCLLGDLGAPHVIEGVPITIPYAALRSYVLPGTPLARVVAAQGR